MLSLKRKLVILTTGFLAACLLTICTGVMETRAAEQGPLSRAASEALTHDAAADAVFQQMTLELKEVGACNIIQADDLVMKAVSDKFDIYFLGELYGALQWNLPGYVIRQYQTRPHSTLEKEVAKHYAAQKMIRDIVAGCPFKEPIQQVLYFHDYLCEHVDYDLGGLAREKNGGRSVNRSVYDTLTTGYGVCDGYARTMYALCSEAGIPVRYIRGRTAVQANHAWNEVLIGGQWWIVDVTNDDLQSGRVYTNFLTPVNYVPEVNL